MERYFPNSLPNSLWNGAKLACLWASTIRRGGGTDVSLESEESIAP